MLEVLILCLSALLLGLAIGVLVSVSSINSKNEITIKIPAVELKIDGFNVSFDNFPPLSLNAHIETKGADYSYLPVSLPLQPPLSSNKNNAIKIETEAFIPPANIEEVNIQNVSTEARTTDTASDISAIASKLRNKKGKEQMPNQTIKMMSEGEK